MRHLYALTLTVSLVAACSEIPGLDEAAGEQEDVGPYPHLLTHEELTELTAPDSSSTASDETLQVRTERLQARAAKLRNTSLTTDDPLLLPDEVQTPD